MCVIFFILLKNNLDKLSLMNTYTKGNYNTSNQIYTNFGLLQLMTLTNQTDPMLYDFFINDGTKGNYLRQKIQDSLVQIITIFSMEKKYPFFTQLNQLIDINCDTLYHNLHDQFIELMVGQYPDTNYFDLYTQYCNAFEPLHSYQNPKLAMMLVAYQTSTLLEMDRNLTYLIYSEILILITPLRQFVIAFLNGTVIARIISDYRNMMIIFLVFNFVFESIILVVVKYLTINRIIDVTNEIIIVAKAFDCFA